MNETELQKLLKGRSGFEQRLHAALRERGKLTDRELRVLLGSPGSGPHDALKKMLPDGLVRHAGKADTKGKPMLWEATPAAEIEETRERFDLRKPKGRRRAQVSPGSRLAERRQMEPGDCRKWYPVRDEILATLSLLSDVFKMSYWESVPPDELRLALAEIEELHDSAGDALAAGRDRLDHEKNKELLAKLEADKGRTPPERETARRKADRVRQKLIDG